MALPHAVARFNRRVTNRFIEPIVRRTSGFAVAVHAGRRTGSSYRTPLYVFGLDDPTAASDQVLVVLTYGPRADWFQNVVKGGGHLETSSGVRSIASIERVDRTVAGPALPWHVRTALRVLRVGDVARLDLAAHGMDPVPSVRARNGPGTERAVR